MRTVFGLLSSTVLSSLLLATACNFTDGATAGNGDPYATCISDTVTFCEARSLSDSDCNALISSTCGDVAGGNGLLDAGVTASADASTGGNTTPDAGDNSGSGNGSGSNASCVDNAIAQCEQFGGSADQCAQVAQQLCSGGGNGSGFGGGGNGSGGGSGGGSGSGSGSGGHHGGGGGNGGGNGSGGGSGGGGGNGGGNGSGGGSGAGSGSAAAEWHRRPPSTEFSPSSRHDVGAVHAACRWPAPLAADAWSGSRSQDGHAWPRTADVDAGRYGGGSDASAIAQRV